jgi:hypothetical protein
MTAREIQFAFTRLSTYVEPWAKFMDYCIFCGSPCDALTDLCPACERLHKMNVALLRSFDRLERYTQRARRSIELDEYALAMADLAEAAYIARQLWNDLQKANQEKEVSHD